MDTIEVSNGDIEIGSNVQLTDDAKTKETDDGVLTYQQIINDMDKEVSKDYLLVIHINKRDKIITVIIPDDQSGSYRIYEPMDLK